MNSRTALRLRLLGISALIAVMAPMHAHSSGTNLSTDKKARDGFANATSRKPGSGVSVHYRLEGQPQAGSPATLLLRFGAITADDGARVEFRGTDGLQLTGADPLTLERGATREVLLQVVPPGNGAYRVVVTTTQDGRSSVTAVPINVGNAQPKLESPGTAKTTPSGERIISLPSN